MTTKQRTKRSHKPARGRRVLQRPRGVDEFGTMVAPAATGSVEEWARARRDRVEAHQVVRLTDDGIDWGAKPGPGDEIGYCMAEHRGDDCLQVAIATVSQAPIEQVPDLALDRRLERGEDPAEIARTTWERIDTWATKRGLVGLFWDEEEIPVPRRRWIGVVELGGGPETFRDHCLVMDRAKLVFDPSVGVRSPPGYALRPCHPSEITYGISFDQKE